MQYWADIKYKARKKSAAGGALGDLSSAEERLRGILDKSGECAGSCFDSPEVMVSSNFFLHFSQYVLIIIKRFYFPKN